MASRPAVPFEKSHNVVHPDVGTAVRKAVSFLRSMTIRRILSNLRWFVCRLHGGVERSAWGEALVISRLKEQNRGPGMLDRSLHHIAQTGSFFPTPGAARGINCGTVVALFDAENALDAPE